MLKDHEIPRYHSRRGAERAVDDADQIWKIIGKAKYVTLAMVTSEGEPYCIPISHGYDREENCLYFHTGFKGKKIDALKENPRVCAFVLDDEGYVKGRCHHEYYSVICYGTVTEIEGRKEKLVNKAWWRCPTHRRKGKKVSWNELRLPKMRALIPDEDMSAVLESLGKSKEDLQELIEQTKYIDVYKGEDEEQVQWIFD